MTEQPISHKLDGLKNLIKPDNKQTEKVVAAFIDTESDNIFEHLIKWEPFQEMALNYIVKEAPPSIQKHFHGLLTRHKHGDLAKKIKIHKEKTLRKTNLNIFAVDDSPMILKLYTKKIVKI